MNLEEKSDRPLQKPVETAVIKFDLSPVDTEFLIGFIKRNEGKSIISRSNTAYQEGL
jgi:ethanolamine utilization microcompartment shell protein EutS